MKIYILTQQVPAVASFNKIESNKGTPQICSWTNSKLQNLAHADWLSHVNMIWWRENNYMYPLTIKAQGTFVLHGDANPDNNIRFAGMKATAIIETYSIRLRQLRRLSTNVRKRFCC